MHWFNDNYHFSIAMFGRKQTGKMSFLLMMLDRNDITITDTFQNEDYYKVSYHNPGIGQFNVYKYIGFENNVSYLDSILQELSSFIEQLDYILYFVGSIKNISDFDRMFIQRLKEKGVMVFCIFNKHAHEEMNMIQLYIEQGNSKVASYFCNCVNRPDVIGLNCMIEQYARDEVKLYDLTQFLLEEPRTVLFLEPIKVGANAKNVYTKYYELFKSVVSKNGVAIYMNKNRLIDTLQQHTIQPDVLITGDKVILNVEDMIKYI